MMSTQLVFLGPSTAGKTSLMLGLQEIESDYEFTVDRTWTTRNKRPNEDDRENIFTSTTVFNLYRDDFMLTFGSAHGYEYGISRQTPLSDAEIRMRILTPVMAIRFKELVDVPVVTCSIKPFCMDPESVFSRRDPQIDDVDLQDRLSRFQRDIEDAESVAEISFQNSKGLSAATFLLRGLIEDFIQDNKF